jgi:regulator of replication initiation timing
MDMNEMEIMDLHRQIRKYKAENEKLSKENLRLKNRLASITENAGLEDNLCNCDGSWHKLGMGCW